MKSNQIRTMTITGVFAALIFLATWAFHVPIGLAGGYVHFGDALIYIAATLLPMPYAMLAGAIGAGLSDLLSPGGAIWFLPTILIKPLCCLAFTRRGGKVLCPRNLLALVAGFVITSLGYAVATAAITGSWAVAIADIPLGAVQPIGSGVIFVAFGLALDRGPLRARRNDFVVEGTK